MEIIKVKYKVFWQIIGNEVYKVTKCKKIINSKKGTVLSQRIKGGSVGWWVGKKFIKRKEINNYLEAIPKKENAFF